MKNILAVLGGLGFALIFLGLGMFLGGESKTQNIPNLNNGTVIEYNESGLNAVSESPNSILDNVSDFEILDEYTYYDSLNSKHFVTVIKANTTGSFKESVIVTDKNGNIVGTDEDEIALVQGTSGYFDVYLNPFSTDENLNEDELEYSFTYESNTHTLLTPANDSFKISKYNQSGEYLYLTVEKINDETVAFPKIQALFFKDGKLLSADFVFADDLSGVGSTSICKIWQYRDYDEVQLFTEGW